MLIVLPDPGLAFLFRTIVNGAKSLDKKHVLTAPNNGYVESMDPDIEGDGPNTKFIIGDARLKMGDVILVIVSERISVE